MHSRSPRPPVAPALVFGVLVFSLLAAFVLLRNPSPNQTARGPAAGDPASPRRLDHPAGREAAARVSENYGRLPVRFEANRGQTDREVKFFARGGGYNLFLTPTEAVVTLRQPAARRAAGETAARRGGVATAAPVSTLRMRLAGANPAPRLNGRDELPGRVNYFSGGDARAWHPDVPNYAKVEYAQVYPGVDLVYYGNQRQLEYDFRVAPGSDPARIALTFEGAQALRVDEAGDLVLKTEAGELRQLKPVAYQEVGGRRQEVAAHYRVEGGGRVRFELGAYDRGRALVIDPILSYSTLLGGTDADFGIDIAVDDAGNAYVAGGTHALDFPGAAAGAQPSFGGGANDVFVAKLSPDGSQLLYASYLGGSGNEYATGLVIDAAGNAYVSGDTISTDFPTTPGARQTSLSGDTDAFIAKLAPDGASLAYSTYLGGPHYDSATSVVVDADGNAYVSGRNRGGGYPTTPGSFRPNFTGNPLNPASEWEGFASKLNASGSALVYSTYLGGTGNDKAWDIALGPGNTAYVAGQAGSADFPTSSGLSHGVVDHINIFVTRLDATGSAINYSALVGGTGEDEARAVAVDREGNAYVTGRVFTTDFPVTPGAFQATNPGITPGRMSSFVTKLSPDGSALVFSTYFGADLHVAGYDIAVDTANNPYLTGWELSNTFPDTPDAFPRLPTSGRAFVTKMNNTGTGLISSTRFGLASDGAYGIALDRRNNAYIIGYTYGASEFPVTPGAYQTAQPGDPSNFAAFIAKMEFPLPSVPPGQRDNGKIAYAGYVGPPGGSEIFTMEADGSNKTRLTNDPADDLSPAWSPDGSRIAFSSNRGYFEIWVMNADGSNPVRLTYDESHASNPAWSPDGTKIAYTSSKAPAGIYVINADGSDRRLVVAAGATGAGMPAWSPDGSRLAFQGSADGAAAIFTVGVDGSNLTRLTSTPAPGGDMDPHWSPDGSRIVFSSVRDGFTGRAVYVMNADGSGQTRLTAHASADDGPSWSPDGSKVVFWSYRNGRYEVFTMNADGSNQTVLNPSPDPEGNYPSWQPVLVAQPTPTPTPDPANYTDLYSGGWIEQFYVPSGSQATFTVFAYNAGGTPASNVRLTGQLPAGATLAQIVNEHPDASCAAAGGGAGFTCTFPALGANEARHINVLATVTGAPYTDHALALDITSDTPDLFPDNNAGSVSFRIGGPPVPTPTPGPAGDDQLAYVSANPARGHQYDVYRRRADGSGLLNLTDSDGGEEQFAWSPDGGRVAFLRYDFANQTVALYTVNADGGDLRQLVNVAGEYIGSYAWAPDGSKLAFTARAYDGTTNDQIYVVNADGTGRVNVSGPDGRNDDVSWSPDSTRVAFTRLRHDFVNPFTTAVVVAQADGGAQLEFAHPAGENDERPVWSPDGSRLAFTRGLTDFTSHVYTARPDGTDVRKLVSDPGVESFFARWSPNGSKLSFLSTGPGGMNLQTVNADGTGRAVVYAGPAADSFYAVGAEQWSPDSTRLAFQFTVGEGQAANACVAGADGSNLLCFGHDREYNSEPVWSPDGRRLAFQSQRNGVSSIDLINADGTGRVELTADNWPYMPRWRPRQPDTPAGSDVTVTEGGVSLTFSNVTTAGETTVTPIDPNSLQGIPGEYVVNADSLAFEITTTAAYAGPITIGFQVPTVNDPTAFAALRVFHGEPAPNFVDRTVLAPDSPSHDFAARTVYARVNSLSPFVIAGPRPDYGVRVLFDQDKSHKSGSVVPVKLQVTGAGGANLSSPGLAVRALGVTRVSTNASVALADAGNANPDFNFRYSAGVGDGGGYVFNLSTRGYATGTYLLKFRIGSDPATRTVQFQVR